MSRLKILVVEDEPVSARVIQKGLETYGYNICAVAASGEEALQYIPKNKPGLVLMDILLEGNIDGIETANRIKMLYDIPVVYLTGHMDDEKLERAKITEPYGYIMKPFEYRELHSTIEMAVYKHNMEKRVKEREELFYTTLSSICDGVITINKAGMITFMNSTAELLTGWKNPESAGKQLKEVFNIIDEVKGNEIENIVEDIMKRNVFAGFSNHIELISKDNRRISIEHRGSPIRDGNGNILGAVLIFHDITDVKRAQVVLRNSFFDLAKTISRAIEYRDPYTAGHQRRVAELAKRIGMILGYVTSKLDEVYIGGLLHDIGKITVPLEILSKPSKLTETEFKLIMEHPQKGYEIVEDTKLPWDVADIILHHHEKLDGSGYPHGIKGEEISQNVRIITVCDIVESMSTFRPYRPANTERLVLEELKVNRGIKYDEEVVDIMIDIIESGQFNPWEPSQR